MKLIQQDLFDRPTLNTAKAFKEACNRVVKGSRFSREQLVDRMNDLADRHGVSLVNGKGRLTPETFEKWINPNDLTRQMPLRALPIFCAAVEDSSVLDEIVKPIGLRTIDQAGQQRLAWADAQLRIRKERKLIRKLEENIHEE